MTVFVIGEQKPVSVVGGWKYIFSVGQKKVGHLASMRKQLDKQVNKVRTANNKLLKYFA